MSTCADVCNYAVVYEARCVFFLRGLAGVRKFQIISAVSGTGTEFVFQTIDQVGMSLWLCCVTGNHIQMPSIVERMSLDVVRGSLNVVHAGIACLSVNSIQPFKTIHPNHSNPLSCDY